MLISFVIKSQYLVTIQKIVKVVIKFVYLIILLCRVRGQRPTFLKMLLGCYFIVISRDTYESCCQLEKNTYLKFKFNNIIFL